MMLTLLILMAVTLERFGELAVAERNTRRLKAAGAVEMGQRHYPWITAVLTVWLVGLWLLAWKQAPNLIWLMVFFTFMALKLWVIATLGRRWTARIIISPNEPLVTGGAYRVIPHPNYVFLMGEIVSLPMVFGLGWYAGASALLVGAMLMVRIRSEDQALSQLAGQANPS